MTEPTAESPDLAELPADLPRYMAAQEQRWNTRRAEMLDALTDRERALVGEAATMGFVQGSLHRRDIGAGIPTVTVIVGMVLEACDWLPDVYPTIAALGRPAATRTDDEEE